MQMSPLDFVLTYVINNVCSGSGSVGHPDLDMDV